MPLGAKDGEARGAGFHVGPSSKPSERGIIASEFSLIRLRITSRKAES